LLFLKEKFITITQGDRIHHPHHGIGKVESIRTRSFSGENGTRFAKIFFKRDSITLMLRENQLDDMIRKPMGLKEAKKLMAHLKSWKGQVSNQWKPRATAHQLKMEEGEPMRYAEVYKNLRTRQEEGTLSAADRKHLRQCSEVLAEELANAFGKTPSEALDQITLATQQ
jgi:RNA polymerase-interacting CarD/CdnL/TRCF family regulator